MKSRFIYEIAQNVKEAMALAAGGYGYESKSAAEKALADPAIDSYYRNRLKVIRLKTIEECPVCGEDSRPHSHEL